ncbi:hypothetical protein EGW08_007887, partial [Elysia chlorotica]
MLLLPLCNGRAMTSGDYAWYSLYVAGSAISALALCKLAGWIWREYKLAMNEDYKVSSVDPHAACGEGLGSDPVISRCRVTVELVQGKCHVENGDEALAAKCNAALA